MRSAASLFFYAVDLGHEADAVAALGAFKAAPKAASVLASGRRDDEGSRVFAERAGTAKLLAFLFGGDTEHAEHLLNADGRFDFGKIDERCGH